MLTKKLFKTTFIMLLALLMLCSMGVLAKGKFTYWSMWEKGEPQQQVIEQAIKDFEKEFDVEVDVKWVGRDVVTALKPRLLAGENIDLTDQCGEELYGGLVAHGAAAKLNDVLEMKVPGEEQVVKDILIKESYSAYVKEDGSLYIIPYNFITSAFWYDKNLFKELNIKIPKTWDEFLEMTDQLKENGYEPIAFGLQTEVYRGYFPYLTAVRILGAGSLRAAAGDPTGKLFEDPRWEEVGNVLYTFSKKGKNLLMEGYESSVYPAPQMDWIMGLAGTFYCGSWIPIETKKAAGPDFEYGAFQFPVFENGEGDPTAVESYPIGFSILKDAKNANLAKKFIAYFLKEKYARAWVEDTMNMTPRKGIDAPPELKDVKEALDNANSTFRYYDGIQGVYPEWYANVFLPLTSDILTGKITGKEFAEQLRLQTIEFWKGEK